jgi:hypothetical protein
MLTISSGIGFKLGHCNFRTNLLGVEGQYAIGAILSLVLRPCLLAARTLEHADGVAIFRIEHS